MLSSPIYSLLLYLSFFSTTNGVGVMAPKKREKQDTTQENSQQDPDSDINQDHIDRESVLLELKKLDLSTRLDAKLEMQLEKLDIALAQRLEEEAREEKMSRGGERDLIPDYAFAQGEMQEIDEDELEAARERVREREREEREQEKEYGEGSVLLELAGETTGEDNMIPSFLEEENSTAAQQSTQTRAAQEAVDMPSLVREDVVESEPGQPFEHEMNTSESLAKKTSDQTQAGVQSGSFGSETESLVKQSSNPDSGIKPNEMTVTGTLPEGQGYSTGVLAPPVNKQSGSTSASSSSSSSSSSFLDKFSEELSQTDEIEVHDESSADPIKPEPKDEDAAGKMGFDTPADAGGVETIKPNKEVPKETPKTPKAGPKPAAEKPEEKAPGSPGAADPVPNNIVLDSLKSTETKLAKEKEESNDQLVKAQNDVKKAQMEAAELVAKNENALEIATAASKTAMQALNAIKLLSGAPGSPGGVSGAGNIIPVAPVESGRSLLGGQHHEVIIPKNSDGKIVQVHVPTDGGIVQPVVQPVMQQAVIQQPVVQQPIVQPALVSPVVAGGLGGTTGTINIHMPDKDGPPGGAEGGTASADARKKEDAELTGEGSVEKCFGCDDVEGAAPEGASNGTKTTTPGKIREKKTLTGTSTLAPGSFFQFKNSAACPAGQKTFLSKDEMTCTALLSRAEAGCRGQIFNATCDVEVEVDPKLNVLGNTGTCHGKLAGGKVCDGHYDIKRHLCVGRKKGGKCAGTEERSWCRAEIEDGKCMGKKVRGRCEGKLTGAKCLGTEIPAWCQGEIQTSGNCTGKHVEDDKFKTGRCMGEEKDGKCLGTKMWAFCEGETKDENGEKKCQGYGFVKSGIYKGLCEGFYEGGACDGIEEPAYCKGERADDGKCLGEEWYGRCEGKRDTEKPVKDGGEPLGCVGTKHSAFCEGAKDKDEKCDGVEKDGLCIGKMEGEKCKGNMKPEYCQGKLWDGQCDGQAYGGNAVCISPKQTCGDGETVADPDTPEGKAKAAADKEKAAKGGKKMGKRADGTSCICPTRGGGGKDVAAGDPNLKTAKGGDGMSNAADGVDDGASKDETKKADDGGGKEQKAAGGEEDDGKPPEPASPSAAAASP